MRCLAALVTVDAYRDLTAVDIAWDEGEPRDTWFVARIWRSHLVERPGGEAWRRHAEPIVERVRELFALSI